MSNLLKTLQNKDLLSESELIISQYLLENYRDFQNLSTRELAKRTFSSSAAVIRFCQKLGFEGYTDFKITFLTEMMKHGGEVQAQIINEHDDINLIMRKVREINVNAINEAYNMLNPAVLSRTLKLLKKATYIDFYAMDGYRDFANRIADSFTLAKKYSTIHSSIPLQYLQAYKVPKNHLGFFISPMGENRFLIDIAKFLKRQDIPTILITAEPDSTLAKIVDEKFTALIGDNVEDLGPLVFSTSAKFIADTLLASLITQTDYKGARDKESWLNQNFYY